MCFTCLRKERVARTGASPTLTRFEVAHPFAPGWQAGRPVENSESCFAVGNGANQNQAVVSYGRSLMREEE
jgi:hypothetical protein